MNTRGNFLSQGTFYLEKKKKGILSIEKISQSPCFPLILKMQPSIYNPHITRAARESNPRLRSSLFYQ